MTATLDSRIEAQLDSYAILRGLGALTPEVAGALLVSADGHTLASDLSPSEQRSIATIVDTYFTLGRKLTEVGSSSATDEMIIRHGSGYVALYAVGFGHALVVVTHQAVNLGLLKLKSAVAVEQLGETVSVL